MKKLENRKNIIHGIFILVFVVYFIRLLFLQVVNTTYGDLANQNVLREKTIYPSRGLIFDRNDDLLVYNQAVYDIMVVPRQMKAMDTLHFCKLLGIDSILFNKQLQKVTKTVYQQYKPNIFLKQISAEIYAQFQEHQYKFPGFFSQVRNIRSYSYSSSPHILGDIGEVDSAQIKLSENYYKAGDYVGNNGIEKSYEEYLRGVNGLQYLMVDNFNRETGRLQNGEYDVVPQDGKDLKLTIDMTLQLYGERLMQNKRGSIVAIEPASGEVLSLISSPYYNPNILSGRKRGDNYMSLINDTVKPLFNRPLMAQYPPGSIFKAVLGLIALQEQAISTNFSVPCGGPNHPVKPRCSHNHKQCRNLREAIEQSCNPYFSSVFARFINQQKFVNEAEAMDQFNKHLQAFGLGKKLNIDLPNELPGSIPSTQLYDNLYGKDKWKFTYIRSLSIGQGEFGITPLQMANMTSAIANRGRFITPHVVKEIMGTTDHITTAEHNSLIEPSLFDPIINGLEDVVTNGTAKIAQIDNISICGKTGTVENPHGEDHSVFIAFAPKENPKIAIAVFVENSGYGSAFAAPIASLMMKKYLNDTVAKKRIWLEENMINAEIDY